MKLILGLTIALAPCLTSCGSKDSTPRKIVPERTYSESGLDSQNWGSGSTNFGLASETPVVYLEYTPMEAGRAALESGCLDPLPNDFELGYAQCNDSDERVPVYAKNVEQHCLSKKVDSFQTRGIVEPISLTCSNYQFFGFNFVPSLRYDTIRR